MSAPPRVRAFTVLIASVLAFAVLAQSASATAPGRNGRIAFKRYLGPDRTSGAIFTITPGGQDERQLTSPPVGASDDFPDNASDGSFVAFQRCVDLCQIFTVPTRGGAPVALTPACPPGGFFPECTDNAGPAISPDTRKIAFLHASGALDEDGNVEHAAIWIMRADGRRPYVLTHPRSRVEEDGEAQWSPDGRRLVFTRVILATQQHAVFTVRADGTGLRQLTPYSLDAGDGPDWSPDGSHILFRTHESEDFLNSNLATISPDGSGFRLLTHVPPNRMVLSSSYSPDGRYITSALGGVGGLPDVFIMRADGTGEHPVTSTPVWDSAPDWGPRVSHHHHHH